jgi:hypothetical protein
MEAHLNSNTGKGNGPVIPVRPVIANRNIGSDARGVLYPQHPNRSRCPLPAL